MEHTTTIRTELEQFMAREGLSITQFCEMADVETETVDAILGKKMPFSVEQLDRVTYGMGLNPGHFYEHYIKEYLVEVVPDWRYIKPFLYRCEELDKLDCIRQTSLLGLDNKTYAPLLFEVAEDFFIHDKHAAAALLYRNIVKREGGRRSERLALCQYRLFILGLGPNKQKNVDAANRVFSLLDQLDDIDRLDALRELAIAYSQRELWDLAKDLAQDMDDEANIQYLLMHQPNKVNQEPLKKPQRPMFFYMAYSNYLRANICEAQGSYKQALQYTYAYANLSWVKETDEETQYWLNKCKEWARSGIFLYKMLSGDVSAILDYVTCIEASQTELMSGLFKIVRAANQQDIKVDYFLNKFETDITAFMAREKAIVTYTHKITPDLYILFLYELAHYYLSRGAFDVGFQYLIDGLEKAFEVDNKSCIINYIGLYEHSRLFASRETDAEYTRLMTGMYLKDDD
ncbi:tetratricopeptide repeat protein [Paenibacillus sp. NPDC055715]